MAAFVSQTDEERVAFGSRQNSQVNLRIPVCVQSQRQSARNLCSCAWRYSPHADRDTVVFALRTNRTSDGSQTCCAMLLN